MDHFFRPGLTREQLVQAAAGWQPPDAATVAAFVATVPPPAIEGLLRAVREARAAVSAWLIDPEFELDRDLLTAVTAGEYLIANLGPGGRKALDAILRLLDDELVLDEDLSIDLSGLAHAALRSMGPAAVEAVDALKERPDDAEVGETLATLVAGDPEHQDALFRHFRETRFRQLETALALHRQLDRPQLTEYLVEACDLVRDGEDRNRLVAYLQEAHPDHPALPELIARYRGRADLPPGETFPTAEPGSPAPGSLPTVASGSLPAQAPGSLPTQAPGSLPTVVPGLIPKVEPTHLLNFEAGPLIARAADPEAFAADVQAVLARPEFPTDRFLADLFHRLSRASVGDVHRDPEALVIDSALAASLGPFAARLRAELEEFLTSGRGNGMSRSHVFKLIADSRCPELLWPLVRYLSTAGSDFDSALSEGLRTAGKLLSAEPALSLELFAREPSNLGLRLLAAADRVAPELGRLVLEADWADPDLAARILGSAGPASPAAVAFLKGRCRSDDAYSRTVAREALARCWTDTPACLELIRDQFADGDYAFGVYKGWVDPPTALLRRFGEEAAPLADLVVDYALEEGDSRAALDLLLGLGPAACGPARRMREALRRDDPLEREEATRALTGLLRRFGEE